MKSILLDYYSTDITQCLACFVVATAMSLTILLEISNVLWLAVIHTSLTWRLSICKVTIKN
jgi:hypothetical protein